MAISDVRALSALADVSDVWERIGARAMILVPLVREGVLKALLYVHEAAPREWLRSEVAIARDVAERTWDAVERVQAEQSLRESEDHYRHAVELNPQVSWTALPDGRLNRVALRWHDWTGTSGLGDTWSDAIHPHDLPATRAAWRRSVDTGEAYDIEHRVLQRDGSFRWARSRAFARRNEAGAISLWYGAIEDIHERRIAEDRQRLLVNELNHRVKNTLATVQAIALQTLKDDLTMGEARRRFEARLIALSRAHNLLTEQNWEGAALDQVVRDALDFLPKDRFEVEGKPVWLGSRAALGLALALHELSTNAAKYGALSGPAGRVAIAWRIEGERLKLEWKERGGPPVVPPSGRGFGSRLIERGLGADLGGKASLLFESDGVRCVIDASLEAIRGQEPALG